MPGTGFCGETVVNGPGLATEMGMGALSPSCPVFRGLICRACWEHQVPAICGMLSSCSTQPAALAFAMHNTMAAEIPAQALLNCLSPDHDPAYPGRSTAGAYPCRDGLANKFCLQHSIHGGLENGICTPSKKLSIIITFSQARQSRGTAHQACNARKIFPWPIHPAWPKPAWQFMRTKLSRFPHTRAAPTL